MLRVEPEEVKAIEWAAEQLARPEHKLNDPALVVDAVAKRLREELKTLLALMAGTTNETDSQVYMDADMRHTMISHRPLLALDDADQELVLPWYFLKETVAQILNYEVWQSEVLAHAEGRELSEGQKHKKKAAEMILKEASEEKSAFIAKARGVTPAPKIQIPGVDF